MASLTNFHIRLTEGEIEAINRLKKPHQSMAGFIRDALDVYTECLEEKARKRAQS